MSDERARLRAKLAQAKDDVPRYWADRQVSVTLGEVARLLDDVERLSLQLAGATKVNSEELVHTSQLQAEVGEWRARAERLEAALPLARYGLAILEMHREDCGDVNGDTLQDTAERCGLLVNVTATEPCGDECRCADYYSGDEWPVECLRYSPAAKAAFAALAEPAPEVKL